MDIVQTPSANFDQRRDGMTPTSIILHYTGTLTAEEAHARFLNAAPVDDGYGRLSTHYMIDGVGKIFQYVDEAARAWHAGVSCWRGMTDMNSASIGIEVWNPGHAHGYPDFLPVQIEAVKALCHSIMDRWSIAPDGVLGHADIAPGRKIDPGEKFPWKMLADDGIGIWPDKFSPGDQAMVGDLLVRYGYNPAVSQDVLIDAFCQHYWPEKYRKITKGDRPMLAGRLAELVHLTNRP